MYIGKEVMRFYEAHCTCTLFGILDDAEMFELSILGEDGIPNHCDNCLTPFIVTFQFEWSNA